MPTVGGRSPEAHFQRDDPWISSMHAMFERRGADLWVVDLESRNGTFVGVERVQEALLAPGAVLRFGRTEMRIELDGARRRDREPPRTRWPASPSGARPTRRLDAPCVTAPGVTIGPVRPPEAEALPLASRVVTLLRIALRTDATATAVPGAEQARAALDAVERAVLAEGGLAARLPGGALGLFGLTAPSPDDAARALRAAGAAVADVEA